MTSITQYLIHLVAFLILGFVCYKGWGKTFLRTLLPCFICHIFIFCITQKYDSSIIDVLYKIVGVSFILFFIYKALKNQGRLYILKDLKILFALGFSIILSVIAALFIVDKDNTDLLYHIPLILVVLPLFESIIDFEVLFKKLPFDKVMNHKVLPYVILLLFSLLMVTFHYSFIAINIVVTVLFFLCVSYVKYRLSDKRSLFLINIMMSIYYFGGLVTFIYNI